MGGHHLAAPIRNRRDRHDHLHRRYRHALPEGIGAQVSLIPICIAGQLQAAARLHRQIHTGDMPQAKILHVIVEQNCSQLFGYPGEAHIQRMLHAALHILRPPGAIIPVVDQDAANLNRAGIHKHRIQIHRP